MRIRSVGHACLDITANGLSFLTDPWWAGPAYAGQWHAFPEPRPGDLEERPVDYLYLSHGHEDHLHLPTLRRLPRSATVLVPEFLAGGFADVLQGELGFRDVRVLRHGETVRLGRGVEATCYVNAADSMLVLSDGDRVLVDANDALHASPPAVVTHFCELLRRRHPQIDTLFLGYSGASWTPNCVRVAGKDDRAAGRDREEALVATFVEVVERLRPRLACAFAASFALADPALAWVNEVKLEVAAPDVAWRRRHSSGATRVHLLLPDDVVDGVEVTPGPVARPSRRTLTEALAEGTSLASGARALQHLRPLAPREVRMLTEEVDRRAKAQAYGLWGRRPFDVELRLRDNPGTAIRVAFDGRRAGAFSAPVRRGPVSLELRAAVLEAVLREEYGFEAVTIGYGAIARLETADGLARVHDLLRLLRPRKSAWRMLTEEAWQHPAKLARTLWTQRTPLALAAAARLGWLDGGAPTAPAPTPTGTRRSAA